MTTHKTILDGFSLVLNARECVVSKGDYHAHLGTLDVDPYLRNPTGDTLPIPRRVLQRIQAWTLGWITD